MTAESRRADDQPRQYEKKGVSNIFQGEKPSNRRQHGPREQPMPPSLESRFTGRFECHLGATGAPKL